MFSDHSNPTCFFQRSLVRQGFRSSADGSENLLRWVGSPYDQGFWALPGVKLTGQIDQALNSAQSAGSGPGLTPRK